MSGGSVQIDMPLWVISDLVKYLGAHEDEIAAGEKDYGDLSAVFASFLGREPGEKVEWNNEKGSRIQSD